MRYQDEVLRALLEIFFSPKRYQLFHNTLFPVISLQVNTLERTAKAPAVALLRLNITFLTPNRHDEHPRRSFLRGSPYTRPGRRAIPYTLTICDFFYKMTLWHFSTLTVFNFYFLLNSFYDRIFTGVIFCVISLWRCTEKASCWMRIKS